MTDQRDPASRSDEALIRELEQAATRCQFGTALKTAVRFSQAHRLLMSRVWRWRPR
jgi:hypothetical protein